MKKVPRTIDPGKVSKDVLALNPGLFGGAKGAPTSDPATGRTKGAGEEPARGKWAPRRGKQPNKTEAQFGQLLKLRWHNNEFTDVIFEGAKLRLGECCYYCPDWMAVRSDGGITFFEVKGARVWEDSLVKFKAARERHVWARFEMWQKKAGSWSRVL